MIPGGPGWRGDSMVKRATWLTPRAWAGFLVPASDSPQLLVTLAPENLMFYSVLHRYPTHDTGMHTYT